MPEKLLKEYSQKVEIPHFPVMKQVWTNDSPGTAFSEKTVEFSDFYDAYFISFFASTENQKFMVSGFFLADNGETTQRLCVSNYYLFLGARDANIYSNKIVFGNAYLNLEATISNITAIPYKIIGIKF